MKKIAKKITRIYNMLEELSQEIEDKKESLEEKIDKSEQRLEELEFQQSNGKDNEVEIVKLQDKIDEINDSVNYLEDIGDAITSCQNELCEFSEM